MDLEGEGYAIERMAWEERRKENKTWVRYGRIFKEGRWWRWK